jgi:hypothetical protein
MICLYPNPETSETAGSYETLWEACQLAARTDGAELVRGGLPLAVSDGERWTLTRDGWRALVDEGMGKIATP